MKYSAKHIAEYVLVRSVCGIFQVVPYSVAVGIGCGIAWISHLVLREGVARAVARIEEVFPGKYSSAQAGRIAWISWRNFVLSIVDMVRLPMVNDAWLRQHIENHDEPMSTLRNGLPKGRGAVLVCPHMGSWELASAALHSIGVPVFVFATRQKNKLVDDYITRMRSRTGVSCIRRGSTGLRSAIQKLKSGEVMGILPDVRVPTEGVQVKFLGRNANVGGGMAMFARQAGVPIQTVIVTRIGLTRHAGQFCQAVVPDERLNKNEDVCRMTQLVFDMIDEAITARPEQWFWFNKRWIFDPIDQRRNGHHPTGLTNGDRSGKSSGSSLQQGGGA